MTKKKDKGHHRSKRQSKRVRRFKQQSMLHTIMYGDPGISFRNILKYFVPKSKQPHKKQAK